MIDRETRLCCFGRGEVCWLNAEVQGIRKRMVRQEGAGHGSTSCHYRPMSSRFETWTSWSSGAMFGSQCRAAMCQTEHQHAWCTVYICGRTWTAGWTTLHGTMGFSGVISLLLLRVYGVVCVLSQLCLLLGLSMYTIVTPTGLNILVSCLKRYQINPLPLRK